MAIRLTEIKNEEHEKLAKLIGELKQGMPESAHALLDDEFARLTNASLMPRCILEADTPEELQAAMEKVGG